LAELDPAELVAAPEAGRIFERTVLPGIAEAVGDGRVRLDAIARWLQDVAYLDLLDAGLSGDGVWLVRRSRIRVERFPRFGEEVTLRTFCSGIGRFSAERRTSITGATAAVEAVALWVWIDPETLRPLRFPDEFVDAYRESAAGRDAKVRLRHPEPPRHAAGTVWRFRAGDLDIAGHVNNASYLTVVEEELAAAEPEALDVEVEYREPAQPGDAFVIGDGGWRWIAGALGETYASIRIASAG
jgi:acyl-ACP thioesterase